MMNRKPFTIAALLVTMIALVLGVALTAGFTRANTLGQSWVRRLRSASKLYA